MRNRETNMKLLNLPLRPSSLSLLSRRGFYFTADVFASKNAGGISTFAAELDATLVEAAGIFREVDNAVKALSPSNSSGSIVSSSSATNIQKQNIPQTAASILSAQNNKSGLRTRPIISFAQTIDSLLGGGFQPKEVTEIVGMPGVGKSQLAMQLCVDTRLPKLFGGVEGNSVYIDSEGSFSPERCLDMANALLDHLQGSVERSNGTKQLPEGYTADVILDSIHVFRVFDEASQTATIRSMPEFMKNMEDSGRPIKLLVIDSIAFHYRCSSSDYKSRTKSLANIAALLSDIASKLDIAVVVINQMTTKIGKGTALSETIADGRNRSDSARVVPALGESWAHSTTTRLLLTADYTNSNRADRYQSRLAKLVKSPHKPAGTAVFSITPFGIRGAIPAR